MKNYYFCNSEFKKHFPDKILNSSEKFSSGYSWDTEEYYVVELDNFEGIEKYYNEVIEPYNNKSHCPIDFWIYEICDSFVDIGDFDVSRIKRIGLINAIEQEPSLSKERNIAYAIYKLTEQSEFNNPIDFINENTKTS